MENTVPFLSVVVPAYNVESYIRECVDSILKQSFSDFEVILVDDGATDMTGEICDAYADSDKRVRVLHKENGGLVSARKAGIDKARGLYIAYVDGDDWIAPNMFEELCGCAEREKADIVIADFICAYNSRSEFLTQNIKAGSYSGKELTESVYSHMLCSGEYFSFGFQPSVCGKIIKKEILCENQMKVDEHIKLGEDAACFYPCLLAAERVCYLKEHYFYYYRMRDTSISHTMIKSYYTKEILTLVGGLQDRFSSYSELWPILEGQLWRYACYMLDNMFSARLSFRTIFFSKEFRKQLDMAAESSVGKKAVTYCGTIRTSSRMKRILFMMHDRSMGAKVNLYLFWKYEKVIGALSKIKKRIFRSTYA